MRCECWQQYCFSCCETHVPLSPACCMSFCTVGSESYARCHWWWHWGLSVSMRVNGTESQVNLRERMHFEGLRWLGFLGIHLFKFLCRSLTFVLFLGYLIFTLSKLHASQYKLCIKNSANFRWTLPTLRTLILKQNRRSNPPNDRIAHLVEVLFL